MLFNTQVLTGAEYSVLEGISVGFGRLGAAIAFLQKTFTEDICVALGEFDVGVGRVRGSLFRGRGGSLFRGRGLDDGDEQVHQFGGVGACVIGLGSGYIRRRTEVAG